MPIPSPAERPDAHDDHDFHSEATSQASLDDMIIATPRQGWVYVEHDGALFRGPTSKNPTYVWLERSGRWKPYVFEGSFKPVEWGNPLSEAQALVRIGET